MLNRFIAVSLVAVLMQAQYLPRLNAQSPTTQNPEEAQVRKKVEKWGAGKKVTVHMIDGNSHKGPIIRIAKEDFSVFDQDRGREVPVGYAQVMSVKTPHSALFKTLVVIGVVFAILGIACAADGCSDS